MEGVGVTHIPLMEDAAVEVESSNKARRTGPGSRAKNYKKFKHKNETSKSAGDLTLFVVGGTKEPPSGKMTTDQSSSELADSTNSIQSKTQIQPATTTTRVEASTDLENNEWPETAGDLGDLTAATAYDDNYYQETLGSEQFRDDDGTLVSGAWSEPSYNFSGLQVQSVSAWLARCYHFINFVCCQITSLNETPHVWSSHREFIAQVSQSALQ